MKYFCGCHIKIDVPSIQQPSISNIKMQQQQHQHQIDRLSNLSDDEPLYDAVASDDDYAALTPIDQNPSSHPHQKVMPAQIKTFKMNSIG